MPTLGTLGVDPLACWPKQKGAVQLVSVRAGLGCKSVGVRNSMFALQEEIPACPLQPSVVVRS